MRLYLLVILMVGLGVVVSGAACADQAQDVKGLVEKAVAMAEKDGKEKTIKAIGNRKGPFVKGAMYVWAGDYEKTSVLAHPFIPALSEAPTLKGFKDEKGNHPFTLFGDVAKKPGTGWVEYWMSNPDTGKVSLKKAYVSAVKGTTIYVGSAYFPK